MRIFIGYDEIEDSAYEVAERSLAKFGLSATPVREDILRMQGLLTRQVDRRSLEGPQRQAWDFASSAPQATAFANTRFFVPLMAHTGWALFTDLDVVFLEDPRFMLTEAVDKDKAVYVVQHAPLLGDGVKMDGQPQMPYLRKNWSSVCLWNCDHPANRRLNLTMLNQWPGRDLHAFRWLADSEIGALDPSWNWLVGCQPKPARPRICHFTLGGPFTPGWPGAEHDEIWRSAAHEL